MCLLVLVLPVFIVCYRIAKCIREITRGSVMCRYLMAKDLIYDRMNTFNNIRINILHENKVDLSSGYQLSFYKLAFKRTVLPLYNFPLLVLEKLQFLLQA